jgi:hypothetical protein
MGEAQLSGHDCSRQWEGRDEGEKTMKTARGVGLWSCVCLLAACNPATNPTDPQMSRTGPTPTAEPTASIHSAASLEDRPQALGGLNLDAYCRSEGYEGVTLTKAQIGSNAAFNNWRCVMEGNTHPFSMEQACKSQYGLQAVQAHPSDPDDAYTWVCYAV